MKQLLRRFLSDFLGIRICEIGWCPAGYILNKQLICPHCGKVIK